MYRKPIETLVVFETPNTCTAEIHWSRRQSRAHWVYVQNATERFYNGLLRSLIVVIRSRNFHQNKMSAHYRRIPFARDLGIIHIGLKAGRRQSPVDALIE
jgi:hypothetical protein